MDYLGLAGELKKALATYTESGGTGKTALDQAEAVALRRCVQPHSNHPGHERDAGMKIR